MELFRVPQVSKHLKTNLVFKINTKFIKKYLLCKLQIYVYFLFLIYIYLVLGTNSSFLHIFKCARIYKIVFVF